MASQDVTNEVLTSIFDAIPPSDDESEDVDYDEEAQPETIEIDGTNVDEEAQPETTEIDGTNIDEEDEEDFAESGPQIGMIFKNRDDLVDAYKAFGKMKGFCVSIRNSRHNYVIISCDRGRKNVNAKKKTKRVDCDAKISARKEKDDYWIVTVVNNVHNHEMDPDIRVVNDRHISRRWKKDVYRPHTKIQLSGGYPHFMKEYNLYRKLDEKFEKCKELIYNNPARMALLDKRLDELIVELSELEAGSVEHGSGSNEDAEPSTNIHVLDPQISNSRGRPKENRLRSAAEKN